MEIVLSYREGDEISLQLPEGISGDIKTIKQDGIGGGTVFLIITAALSRVADIATIAGFIYMIMRDKINGSITIKDEPVLEPYDEEDIKAALEKAISEAADENEATDEFEKANETES